MRRPRDVAVIATVIFALMSAGALGQLKGLPDGGSAAPVKTTPALPAGSPDAGAVPPSGGGIRGGLMVAPTRLVFEGRTRTEELTLVNTSNEEATYRITFTQMRMLDNGDIREITAPLPGERFAAELIRYSPRQVTLAPGATQTVRLQVRKPADLAPGEYRSHLVLRAVPPAQPPDVADVPTTGVGVQLTAVYGVSIPVIVRHGETSFSVRLSKPELVVADGPPALRLKIHRQGNQSAYGNLTVAFTPTGGREVVVGAMNGLAVYTPNPHRMVNVPLRPPPGTRLDKGRYRIAFGSPDRQEEPFATVELAVP